MHRQKHAGASLALQAQNANIEVTEIEPSAKVAGALPPPPAGERAHSPLNYEDDLIEKATAKLDVRAKEVVSQVANLIQSTHIADRVKTGVRSLGLEVSTKVHELLAEAATTVSTAPGSRKLFPRSTDDGLNALNESEEVRVLFDMEKGEYLRRRTTGRMLQVYQCTDNAFASPVVSLRLPISLLLTDRSLFLHVQAGPHVQKETLTKSSLAHLRGHMKRCTRTVGRDVADGVEILFGPDSKIFVVDCADPKFFEELFAGAE